jgi:hypothetical protein
VEGDRVGRVRHHGQGQPSLRTGHVNMDGGGVCTVDESYDRRRRGQNIGRRGQVREYVRAHSIQQRTHVPRPFSTVSRRFGLVSARAGDNKTPPPFPSLIQIFAERAGRTAEKGRCVG